MDNEGGKQLDKIGCIRGLILIQMYSKDVFALCKIHILQNGRLKITRLMGKLDLEPTIEKLYEFVTRALTKTLIGTWKVTWTAQAGNLTWLEVATRI